MVRKFFPLDKNYLLEETQLRVQDTLLLDLIGMAKRSYLVINNPLLIMDAFSQKIEDYEPHDLTPLHCFYQNLAGVYRYKFGENQLDFLWDGKDHSEKYEEDWSKAFRALTGQFCRHPQFVQAVLDVTVFQPENRHVHLAESRMNAVMLNLFELKIHKSKGIVAMKMA